MTSQRLGQHFLEASAVVQSILLAAEISSDDTVVEIGPGLGALTGDIVSRAGRTLLIEYDEGLAGRIADKYDSDRSVRV